MLPEHKVREIENNSQLTTPSFQLDNKTVLFITDLPENTSEMELSLFFGDFKEVIAAIHVNPTRSQNSKAAQNANVYFKEVKKADEARKALNLKKIKGKTIRIVWHEREASQRYSNEHNLFVKNIPLNVKPREVYEFFMQFGDIISAKICEDENGDHYGYGYIHFGDSDSSDKAIKHCENNKVFGETLDVKYFQKKNERETTMTNKNVFIKNIPSNTKESEVKELFRPYGNISFIKLQEENEKMFATLSLDSEEATYKAINNLNGTKFKGNELFVNHLIKKSDRERQVQQIRIGGGRFDSKRNLHVRNIPYEVNDKYLIEVFSKYGEIESAKIQIGTIVTKDQDEFKHIQAHKGFGYVCFVNEESAKLAIEDLNGKRFPKYENWKTPLIISYYMPKSERELIKNSFAGKNGYQRKTGYENNDFMNMMPKLNKMPMYSPQLQGNNYFPYGGTPYSGMPMMNPSIMNPMQMNPNLMYQRPVYPPPNNMIINSSINNPNSNPYYNKMQPRTPLNLQPQINQSSNHENTSNEEPDLKYLESLDDTEAKKDYLGEFIFKKIENHPLSRKKSVTMDIIGKITGMILGIDDVNEIIDIAKRQDQLTQRIQEALELLESTA